MVRSQTIQTLVAAAILPSIWGLTISSFNGKWTDEEPSGYGGSLSACVDTSTGIAQGFYSEVGYTRGTVKQANGVITWAGQWYEGGNDDTGNTWGNFLVTLADDGDSFNGTWTSSTEPDVFNPWPATRLSADPQTRLDCFASNSAALFSLATNSAEKDQATLHGSWHGPQAEEWHVCITDGTFTSSYLYLVDGELTPGYIRGQAQAGGQVLMGEWFESDDYKGMYLIGLGSNKELFSSYWNTTIDALDIGLIASHDAHGVEVTKRISYTATSKQCGKNAYLATGGSPSDDDANGGNGNDDDDKKTSGTVIALATCLAVVCAGIVVGGAYHAYAVRRRIHKARRHSHSHGHHKENNNM